MGETTNIAWTDATWNCVIGCSHVSDGCTHCYAETLANRYGWTKKPWGAQYAAENVQLRPHRLAEPLKWRTPKRVFVNSLSDVFHEQIPDEYIAAMFGVMAASPRHTFQILTKRPERMLRWFAKVEEWTDQSREVFGSDGADWRRWQCLVGAAIRQTGNGKLSGACSGPNPWPLPNVWLGVSVEDQRRKDRIDLLRQTPAAVHFLSLEPLLEYLGNLDLSGIEWVIVGGESGPHFRLMDLDWARSIRDQCHAANVAFFYKQSSGLRSGMNPTLDGQVWQQFPLEANRA